MGCLWSLSGLLNRTGRDDCLGDGDGRGTRPGQPAPFEQKLFRIQRNLHGARRRSQRQSSGARFAAWKPGWVTLGQRPQPNRPHGLVVRIERGRGNSARRSQLLEGRARQECLCAYEERTGVVFERPAPPSGQVRLRQAGVSALSPRLLPLPGWLLFSSSLKTLCDSARGHWGPHLFTVLER